METLPVVMENLPAVLEAPKTALWLAPHAGGEFTVIAGYFKLNPPMPDGIEYVLVSACDIYGRTETYVFEATSELSVEHWGEIAGFKDCLDMTAALDEIGYEAIYPPGQVNALEFGLPVPQLLIENGDAK